MLPLGSASAVDYLQTQLDAKSAEAGGGARRGDRRAGGGDRGARRGGREGDGGGGRRRRRRRPSRRRSPSATYARGLDRRRSHKAKATLLADAASVGASVTEIQWTTSAADADAACAAAFDDVDSAVTASEFLCEAEASSSSPRAAPNHLCQDFAERGGDRPVEDRRSVTLLVGSVPVGVDPISALALIPGINTGAVTLFESAASAAVSTARETSAPPASRTAAAATVSEAAATTLEADAVALEAEVAALETSSTRRRRRRRAAKNRPTSPSSSASLSGAGRRGRARRRRRSNRASVAAALRRVTRRSNRGDARTGAGSNRDRGFDDIGGGGSDDARARRDRHDA